MTDIQQALEQVVWYENGAVCMIDQTLLPAQEQIIMCASLESLWEAIKMLRVRGAPAIGVAAAWGAALAADLSPASTTDEVLRDVERGCDYLATSRPTAVNLFWALNRMRAAAAVNAHLAPAAFRTCLRTEAAAIVAENDATCRAISRQGAQLFKDGDRVITHCNAGGLACANRYGTALGTLLWAHEEGKRIEVFANETRPLLQGARLTAYELQKHGIPVTLICDNMAAYVMRRRGVTAVIFGADRIAANGDTANKIGSYGLACLAQAHRIPVYVAAPMSTFDFSLATGKEIPIEERAAEEVSAWGGAATAPAGVLVCNPAFDVTPAKLISAIICEHGVVRPPFTENLKALRQ